jgi:hypothetical protein
MVARLAAGAMIQLLANMFRYRLMHPLCRIVWTADPIGFYQGKRMLTVLDHGNIVAQVTGCSSLRQALSAIFTRLGATA